MTKVSIKSGDIFSVKIGENSQKYFQYITKDLTQLNSDVVRAFDEIYPISYNPDLSEVIKGRVQFYAHCITKLGVKLGYWKKVGNVTDVGKIDHILFKSTVDYGIKYGEEPKEISHKWWVWKINEDQKYVGMLEGDNQRAYIGLVFNPLGIIEIMKGKDYPPLYPCCP